MSRDVSHGLPAELADALHDHSVVVPQDASVFALIAKWTDAPATTAGSDLSSSIEVGLSVEPATSTEASTTPAAC